MEQIVQRVSCSCQGSCKTSRSILQEDKALPKEGPKLRGCEIGDRGLVEDGQEDLRDLHRSQSRLQPHAHNTHSDDIGDIQAGQIIVHSLQTLQLCTTACHIDSMLMFLAQQLLAVELLSGQQPHLLACCCIASSRHHHCQSKYIVEYSHTL